MAIIGTAGWSIPREHADAFPSAGTTLERYAHVFRGVEINSSFYRPHRPSTWERWAASVPEQFRFAVKIPKTITHQAKLVDAETLVADFAEQVRLAGKLAVLLVQLPPKLAFDADIAERFFDTVRRAFDAGIACEPRHASWFAEDADTLLRNMQVARVAANPALGPAAATPGGWRGLSYWRLHGSPVIYRSAYDDDALDRYAAQIQTAADADLQPWCVFDNTASSNATGNALSLMTKLGS